MFYLVCYDIREPKRLTKVAKECEQYGIRLQKSCFQCDLNAEMMKKLLKRLEIIMQKEEDSLIVYTICLDCLKQIQTEGPDKIVDPDRVIIL